MYNTGAQSRAEIPGVRTTEAQHKTGRNKRDATNKSTTQRNRTPTNARTCRVQGSKKYPENKCATCRAQTWIGVHLRKTQKDPHPALTPSPKRPRAAATAKRFSRNVIVLGVDGKGRKIEGSPLSCVFKDGGRVFAPSALFKNKRPLFVYSNVNSTPCAQVANKVLSKNGSTTLSFGWTGFLLFEHNTHGGSPLLGSSAGFPVVGTLANHG